MRTQSLVGVAVAAALAGQAQAAAPTLADVQSAITGGTAKQFWISGSSAAKKGVQAFVGSNICGGAANETTFTSASPVSNPDFNAFACTATAGPTSGSMTVVYYRAEGGSVVGVLPIFHNLAINHLDLSSGNTTCSPNNTSGTVNCPIAGTAITNGPNDSWGAAVAPTGVVKHNSDMGLSDLEPDAFVGNNSPYANPPPAGYTAGTFGAMPTQAQLKAMPHQTIIQQTFGIVVNNALGTNVPLSKGSVANILAGNYIDWSSVPSFTAASPGAAVHAAAPIFVCNREVGSGTRTGADIFFLGDHCTPGAPAISEGALAGTGISDNFATSDLLTCVQNNGSGNGAPAGAIAIGYVSVDNFGSLGVAPLANVTQVLVDGVTASNYNTAIGAWGWAFEATLQPNAASGNPIEATMVTFLQNGLQSIATTSQKAQVNAIPGQPATNTAQLPLQQTGVVYTTNFFRGGAAGNSCNTMSEAN
jgi:hypothetical protein